MIYIARLYLNNGMDDSDGGTIFGFECVLVSADTEEGAYSKAENHWRSLMDATTKLMGPDWDDAPGIGINLLIIDGGSPTTFLL